MAKGKYLIVTSIVLLFVVLLFSRLYPMVEAFQETNKEDLCAVLEKGKEDIQAQMDQANALMTSAQEQLDKIKESLDEVSKLSTSFEC